MVSMLALSVIDWVNPKYIKLVLVAFPLSKSKD